MCQRLPGVPPTAAPLLGTPRSPVASAQRTFQGGFSPPPAPGDPPPGPLPASRHSSANAGPGTIVTSVSPARRRSHRLPRSVPRRPPRRGRATKGPDMGDSRPLRSCPPLAAGSGAAAAQFRSPHARTPQHLVPGVIYRTLEGPNAANRRRRAPGTRREKESGARKGKKTSRGSQGAALHHGPRKARAAKTKPLSSSPLPTPPRRTRSNKHLCWTSSSTE